MGRIKVEGLGIVEIQGDVPTLEEDKKIRAALAAAQKPTATQSLITNIGRDVRAAATGISSLPLLAADAAGQAINGLAAIPQFMLNPDKAPSPVYIPNFAAGKFQQGMSSLGLPQPGGTAPEALVSAASGVGGPVSIGKALMSAAPKFGPSAAREIGQRMASNVGSQVAGAETGTLASEGVAAAGGGQAAQIAAGIAGGGLVPSGGSWARRTGAGAVEPLTETGRRRVVGDYLASVASDPKKAQFDLERARQIVPGSRPTTAQASGDPGLSYIEGPVFAPNRAPLAARLDEQVAARSILLDKSATNEQLVGRLRAKAEEVAGPLREDAFNNAKRPTLGNSVAAMKAIQSSDKAVNPAVTQAFEFAGQILGRAAGDARGSKLDVRRLYEARKTIADAARGKYDTDKRQMKMAKGELEGLLKAIDADIEAAAPGYRDYMDRYAAIQKAADRVESAASIRQRATDMGATAGGYPYLKIGQLRDGLRVAALEKKSPLTDGQRKNLELVLADLERAAGVNARNLKSPGSDTFKNLSVAHAIGRVFGEAATGAAAQNSTMRAISKPFAWVYGLAKTDDEMTKLLQDAMLDPEFAAALLKEANMRNMAAASNRLRDIAARGAAGGTVSTLANQRQN